ncbi:substrate-binding periplasmic protein [Maridesulfovibrio frigidus]|uniref:substrate-binding periplasmic protein n=1 Tax=Maridesulfovibrio frigidus TaxID=340956 RepID=UPI0004E12A10|nr:transporter substrate-binding domain-containing protein [Maridesulfovibrio frigidus]
MTAKKSILLSLLVLLFTLSNTSIYASNRVSFASFPVPVLIQNSQKGTFIDIVREACSRLNIKPDILIYPPKRSFKYFSEKKTQAFFPAIPFHLREQFVLTTPFHYKRAFAFTRKGTKAITTVSELKGKRVGLTTGFSYPPNIVNDSDITVDFTAFFQSSLKKLQAGRIDCFIGDPDITLNAMKELNLSLSYDLANPIYEEPVFIAFHRTPEGIALADNFSKAISKMLEDGTIHKIKSDLQPISSRPPILTKKVVESN